MGKLRRLCKQPVVENILVAIKLEREGPVTIRVIERYVREQLSESEMFQLS
jgi:hypothetical protein